MTDGGTTNQANALPQEQLVIGNIFLRRGGALRGMDYAESLDACHEDKNGKLPHEEGYER